MISVCMWRSNKICCTISSYVLFQLFIYSSLQIFLWQMFCCLESELGYNFKCLLYGCSWIGQWITSGIFISLIAIQGNCTSLSNFLVLSSILNFGFHPAFHVSCINDQWRNYFSISLLIFITTPIINYLLKRDHTNGMLVQNVHIC